MTDTTQSIEKAQRLTALSLNEMMATSDDVTAMHLNDITAMANEVARILPAGNVVKMVFSQLRSVRGRRIHGDDTRRLMGSLQQGMSMFLDKAAYMAFYTTPAILISGYQLLLRAAGTDPKAAFPNGTWQFYLEFGLREDTARHTCETVGFKQAITEENLNISEADQLAAWMMAVSTLLSSYRHLLAQEWHERELLRRVGERVNDSRLTARWVSQRPYGVPPTRNLDYISYRREVFSRFVYEHLATDMRPTQIDETLHLWKDEETMSDQDRAAYLEQMSLFATLEPGAFSDTRIPFQPEEAYIAVIWQGDYYLVPLMHEDAWLDLRTFRPLAHAILDGPATKRRSKMLDELLIEIPRGSQRTARLELADLSLRDLEGLQFSPVIINWDEADALMPLAEIRRGRRGVGDHALTLFRTDESMVFDQSHIFFDAIWGMAIAEIMTSQAIANAHSLQQEPPLSTTQMRPYQLKLGISPEVVENIRHLAAPTPEVSAEITLPIVSQVNQLRQLLNQRHAELQLTINDFLILYRSLYNQVYRPGRKLAQALDTLEEDGERAAVQAVRTMFQELRNLSPAFLIPIDASAVNPRERVFPVTFCPHPPWTDIGNRHAAAWYSLLRYREAHDEALWKPFSDARKHYFAMLRMFGVLLDRYKQVALDGKSFSTTTLEILGAIPKPLQAMLSNIPDRIDILNDTLKGTEVFSNVGKVADSSSLWRFITAKDDNRKKELCWGIMTRADGTMVITLRDFRAPVTAMLDVGAADVAHLITWDFLVEYGEGLRDYIRQLFEIAQAHRRRKSANEPLYL